MNRGVAERAVPPLQIPPPLLNLQARTFSCTMVSREQSLSVSRGLFCAVCCVKQLQNAVQRVNGSQIDKGQAVMLYRVCFHTRSQKADGLTAVFKQHNRLTGWWRQRPGRARGCRGSSQINCLVNPTSVFCSLTGLLVGIHSDKVKCEGGGSSQTGGTVWCHKVKMTPSEHCVASRDGLQKHFVDFKSNITSTYGI